MAIAILNIEAQHRGRAEINTDTVVYNNVCEYNHLGSNSNKG